MRIMGINAGTSPRFAPLMQERMWIVMRNNAGATAPRGGAVVFDAGGTTYTDSGGDTRLFGYDFDVPETATLARIHGTVDADILDGKFGEIQVYGFDDDVLIEGTTGTTVLDHAIGEDGVFPRKAVAADAVSLDRIMIVEPTANLPANGVNGYVACIGNYMGTLWNATS